MIERIKKLQFQQQTWIVGYSIKMSIKWNLPSTRLVIGTTVTPGNIHDSMVFDEIYDTLTEKLEESEEDIRYSSHGKETCALRGYIEFK